jgi:deoxyadenosine/deoxycytidine kinase
MFQRNVPFEKEEEHMLSYYHRLDDMFPSLRMNDIVVVSS